MTTRVTIYPATTPADLEDVRVLFLEYERWLDHDLCFQGFAAELGAVAADRGRTAG